MLAVFGFFLILGPLVVFHEFGHYIFARLFNVKAEIFSIGFGPKIWSRKIGETEWRLSAIPMGGFVKLLGEEQGIKLTAAEQKRSLHTQKAWKRFFIFFGGPLFNFVLASLVFMAIIVIGEPQMASVVGRVVRGSPADKLGFTSGDQIISINGKAVSRFEEVAQLISENPGKPLDFEMVRKSKKLPSHLIIKPVSQTGFSVYGEATQVGEIDGLLPMSRSATVGVSNPMSVVGKLGVVTGDRVVMVNGTKVESWEAYEELVYRLAPGTKITMVLESEKKGEKNITLYKPEGARDSSSAWGLYSSELFVERTLSKSPAAAAGIKKGDRLVAVGKTQFDSFFGLKDAVQTAGEKEGKVALKWERDGQMMSATVVPNATPSRDAALNKTVQFTVGVAPLLFWNEPVTVIERVYNPFRIFYMGVDRMVSFTWRNFITIQKMITGEVSVRTLGGPILIGKIAGESLTHGLISFLTTMALLSIGLGVLNILP
ncbi:MAG: site-2 protease family protein, partial [Bdellovibrionota bacterium]